MQKRFTIFSKKNVKNRQNQVLKKTAEEARREAAKYEMEEKEKQVEKLKDLTEKSHKVLFKCTAVFPFDLFPDEISIEPTQINVYKRIFFFTAHERSVPIKNVADAIVNTVPFFANLKIVDQYYTENSVDISWLWKRDAECARKIIQGLIVASKEGVDLSKIDPYELRKRVEELGEMREIEEN